MPCYHPLHAFDVGAWNAETGNRALIIRSGSVDHIWHNGIKYTDFIEIPCGRCIGCRLAYSRQWATRCLLEANEHEHNCFITLTYNDTYLPKPLPLYDDDGVIIGESSRHPLVKKDFQLFMKRFRKRLSDDYIRDHPGCSSDDIPKIRFFACGEYGSQSKRPHYHAIIFGFDFPDRRYLKSNFRGEHYYVSDMLDSLWPFGYHTIADCTFDSCAYVARYILKKQYGIGAGIYQKDNFPPEFTLMSRKPGIAREFYEKHKDEFYQNQEIFISDKKKGLKLHPPHYYDKLYDIEQPDLMAAIKSDRLEKARRISVIKDSKSSKSHLDRLLDEEANVIARTKVLKERSKDVT